jgi:translation initiation factor 2 beta subunit (eIF-2beta)/eIF-5
MDFSFIFDEEEYKTRTVIEYLKKEIGNASSYKEQLVIQRSCEDRSLEAIIQENGNKPMGRPLFQ